LGNIILSTVTVTSGTVTDSMEITDIRTIGSLGDPLDENDEDDGTVNGQNNTNITQPYIEIGCVGDYHATGKNCSNADTLIYDESQGDGNFYLDIAIQCDGSNEFCANTIMAFVAESTTVGPEWNEMSSITVSHQSGNALWPSGKADITSYFDRGQPTINIGELTGGQSEVLRFTFNVIESATDGNDDFLIIFDDLGAVGGLDACRNDGLSSVQIDIDFQD